MCIRDRSTSTDSRSPSCTRTSRSKSGWAPTLLYSPLGLLALPASPGSGLRWKIPTPAGRGSTKSRYSLSRSS
eukprot:10593279-Alexandrium_andersonii.AAC.1